MSTVTHKRGDSFKKVIRVRTKTVDAETGAITYAAMNITDATIWFMVKADPTDLDAAALVSKKITSHTTPLSGLSELNCSADDMDFIIGKKHSAEFQILDADGNVMSSETFTWKQIQDVIVEDE